MDQREWYRDLVRKRTGYVEGAMFRVSSPLPSIDRAKPFVLNPVWVWLIRSVFFVLAILFFRWLRT
jgi:hypothetical protein